MSILLAIAVFAEGASAASGAPANVAVAAQPDLLEKKVCKRYVETGSLVKARKDCRTRREWNRISDDMRNDTERMIDRTAIAPTGG